MEYVQVPLNIAIKASRVYRQLLPFVKKHVASMKPQSEIVLPNETDFDIDKLKTDNTTDLSQFVVKSYEEVKQILREKTKAALDTIAREAGIVNPGKLNKEELIAQLTTEEETLI